MQHKNAVNYVNEFGIDAYINNEITPLINQLNKHFIPLKSFAYPNGSRNDGIDRKLLAHFSIIRGTTYGNINPDRQMCFYNGSAIAVGLGIDSSYDHFSHAYLIILLDYAKTNNKVLVLYGHKPVKNVTAKYQTSYETLELICKFVNENNMKFYTLNQLTTIE